MQVKYLVRLLTAALALALFALLSSGSVALAVPPPDGGSVAPKPTCTPVQRLHVGHREQVDRDAVTLCRPTASEPAFPPSAPTRMQPARTTTARGVLVAVLGFAALLASLVASGAWRRRRATRPREAT